MAISNFNGTTAKSFKIGDITIYSGKSPYNYDNLGKEGDIFISTDGTRYTKSKKSTNDDTLVWKIQMDEWSGTEIPDNSLGNNGDLYRLTSSDGISGSKYIKVESNEEEVWLPITNELYSNIPNNELFNNRDYYITDSGDFVKIDGQWIKVEQHLSGDELPIAKIGNNGDIYHDTTSDKFYFKDKGKWYEVTTRYILSNEPIGTYGTNGDIWLGQDNNVVYVRENNLWANKTENNKVLGGNGIIIDDFYPDKTIVTVYHRTYYVKLDSEWFEVGKIYHNEQIPQSSQGFNKDICLNNNNSMVWVKNNNGIWQEGSLVGILPNAPESSYGDDLNVVYTQTSQLYIANNSQVYPATTKTYTDIPTTTDGEVGDIYNVNSSVYYKDSDDNWNILGNSYDYQTTPINCDNDNLNGYLYVVEKSEPETYICNNRQWHIVNNSVTDTTPPSDFVAGNNDVYITGDGSYYVYISNWNQTSMKTSSTDPDDTCGADNDLYIMETKTLAKINNVWTNVTAGQSMDGNGEPDPNIGDINDIYTDLDTGIKYIKVEIDLWNEIGNTYRYDATTPPDSFWLSGTLYTNTLNQIFVKGESSWETIGNVFDARTGDFPPTNYWEDYTIYEVNNTKKIKYNNNWNLISGTLLSTDIPNDYMWVKGVIYNNSTTNYIKTGNANWTLNENNYDADDKPATTFWGDNIIYITSARKYIKTSNVWENVILETSTYEMPDNGYGLNGTIWVKPDYNYYLKEGGFWKRVANIFDKNTAPKYNSFGSNNSTYELANGNAFVKQNDTWNQALDIIEGSEEPFDDIGDVGTLFDLTTDNKTYILYSDYSWVLLGNAYTPNDNPLDTDGEYLWLYIKPNNQDNTHNIVYKNETTWVSIASVHSENNLPTQDDGNINDLWVVLSVGLYVKDSGEWSKIATAGQQEFNARQEIYLFT